MSKKNGRFIVLRDIQDHAIRGDLSLFDLGVYSVIHFQTEFSTGLWFGSAARVHATAPEGASLRDVQRSMEHLEELRFLRSFRKHGQRGNAPYLVHKYEPLTGALRGKRLNAFASDDWRARVYESCALPDTETDALTNAQADTYSVSSTQDSEGRKKKRSAPAVPSPSVFTGQHLSVTQRQDGLLGEAFPWVDRPAEYRKADSWLEANPDRRPKKSTRFLHNWFSKISQLKGKGNGKDVNSAVETTMRGWAENNRITH
jgi:hypothetical protein